MGFSSQNSQNSYSAALFSLNPLQAQKGNAYCQEFPHLHT